MYPWQGDAVNNLDAAQTEQLKEIGAQLRQIRQKQSISTEEVAAKTYIPSRLLIALEEGQSDKLPEPVFIQGFIRRYAQALNLDGDALAQTFPTNLLPTKLETPSQQAAIVATTATTETLVAKREIGLYALYLLLMIGAAAGLFHLVKRPQTAKPILQNKTTVVQQPKTPVKPTTAPLPAPTVVPIQVAISLTDESWMEVIADGKTEFEGTLSQGTQKSWTAKKELKIRAGNAGAVLVTSNRQKEQPLGSPGEVKDITFTPQ